MLLPFFILSILINIALIIYIGVIRVAHKKEVAKIVRIYEDCGDEFNEADMYR